MSETLRGAEFKNIPIPEINPVQGWKEVTVVECGQKLILLNNLASDSIIVNAQYYKQRIDHAKPEMYAREEVGERLIKTAKLLPKGFKLLIWDAWRPLEVQQSLFDGYKKDLALANPDTEEEELIKLTQTYVSLPSSLPNRPSPHYTGGAIDLSIANEKGEAIFMGTEFDHFGPEAAARYFENIQNIKNTKDKLAQENRRILIHSMQTAGFSVYDEEWWHFDFGNQFDAKRSKKDHAIYGPVSLK